jgi:hypothetical protein
MLNNKGKLETKKRSNFQYEERIAGFYRKLAQIFSSKHAQSMLKASVKYNNIPKSSKKESLKKFLKES